jgi:ABC-type uncharacterized transport system substrate-binding protein
MKNFYSAAILFTGIVLASCFISSCSKPDTTEKPKEQQIIGKWYISRVQLKLYYNNVFKKDTIIKQSARPANYVMFDADKNFEYLFNSPTADVGTYKFTGTDSLISTVNTKIYRWKMLTLVDQLFTVMSTSTNDPAFPGAKVETYQTFGR